MARIPQRVSLPTFNLALLGFVSLAASACSNTPAAPAETPQMALADAPLPLEGSGAPEEQLISRPAGELLVHRFSGSYTKSALILREEVLSNDGQVMVVDFQLDDGSETTHLRVKMGARSERVLSVTRVTGGEEIPADVKDFEELYARTSLVPDRNEGEISRKTETCLLGKQELDCEISQYQVRLGEKEARLEVARGLDLGRDVSGEITAVDGTVLYHAELIELEKGEVTPALPETKSAVASAK